MLLRAWKTPFFYAIRIYRVFGKIFATITNQNYLVLSGIKRCLSEPTTVLFWSLLESDKGLSSDYVVLAKASPKKWSCLKE